MSSREVGVVDANRSVVAQLPTAKYNTGNIPTTAVDPVAFKAAQGPTQGEHDRTLLLKSGCNSRGAPLRTMAVCDESGQGK